MAGGTDGPRSARGDCIVYLAGGGAHTLNALEQLDVLAFGRREYDESIGFPRLGMSLVGNRAVDTVEASIDGAPIQFVRESQLGPPELPAETGPRPPNKIAFRGVGIIARLERLDYWDGED